MCIVTSYPPNRARLSEYSKYLIDELAKSSKIDIIYVVADTIDGRENRVMETSKLEIIRTWTPDNSLSVLSLIPKILKLKPSLTHLNVHFQSFGKSRIVNFIGLSLAFLLRLLRVKVLVTIHNLGEKVDLRKVDLNPSFINRVGIAVVTKVLLRADMLTVTVESYVDHLKQIHRYNRAVYIRHGTTLNTRTAHESDDPLEKRILFFGHMAPHKGLPVMLKAFGELLKERADVKLIVAGSNHPNFEGYLETFREETIPNVEYLGYIQERNIEDLFNSADVVVLPYLTTTGTSGVFHLACGFGKPIVASDLPEIREIISEGASAILVRPGDPSSLKKAISDLLDNSKLCIEMSQRNLAYASKETWSKIAEAYEQVYIELVNG